MSNTQISPAVARSFSPLMSLYVCFQLGASVALARPVAPPEALTDLELGAAITPGAQASSYAAWNLQQRQCPLQSDCPSEPVMFTELWDEAELDYSNMDQATRAAASAPAIQVSGNDKRMYSGLSNFPSVSEDKWEDADDLDEPIAIDRSYVARAEQAAARAPMVVLGADSLRALAGIQTHFPRSIDFDEE